MKKCNPLKGLDARLVRAFLILILSTLPTLAFSIAQVESRAGSTHSSPAWGEVITQTPPTQSAEQKIEFLQQEVQELRGKLEELTYQIQSMEENQKKLYLDLESRLNGQTKTTKAAVNNSGISFDELESIEVQKPALNKASVPATQTPPTAETTLYQTAYRQMQAKEFKTAIKNFKDLALMNPGGQFAGNAYYWLGEIYLAQANLDLASKAFETVYKQYPKHQKVADAMLKLGYIEYQRSHWQSAKTLLTQVKSHYPGTTSSQLANARLDRMRQEGRA